MGAVQVSELPPGFTLDPAPQKPRKPVRLDAYQPADDVVDLGTAPAGKTLPMLPNSPLYPTGRIVDGDTFGLAGGRNARLLGVDAFEKGQMGFRPGQAPVNLGDLSAGALSAYIRPTQPVWSTGKQTYGRPVVTLGSGRDDPALNLLRQGTALAAPEYLKTDEVRRALYMEGERLARLNRQGAHSTQHLAPEVDRMFNRGHVKLRHDEGIEFTNNLPELRPEYKRLPEAEEQEYYQFFARNSGNPNFGQADIDAYWKAKGQPSAEASPELIAAIRKGDRFGPVDYSAWDAATLADFNKQNAFAGMRPEVQEAYGALLSAPDSTPEALAQFAEVNGMTFDPRDVKAFYEAKAKGQTAPIPLPLIDPGDGANGAAARGFSDPIGFLDEAGGVFDTILPETVKQGANWMIGGPGDPSYRESIWNSDRSFGDIWENNVRQNRAIIDYDETNHPYARAGGQIVGGALIPFGGGVRGFGNFAKVGAAEGAVYGFGSADGTLGQRLANVPLNTVLGGVTGGTVGKGIEVATPVVKSAAKGFKGLFGSAPRVSAPRTPDSIPLPASQPGTFAPTLGQRVPSVAPASMGRPRDWLDVQQHEAGLPEGFTLDAPQGRADMAGDALPSLSSPRLRDMIDVNAARPTRLLDGPTEAMMNAATARVRPGDLLPRPANEVGSVDEAAAIGKGLYPEVQAPREGDYLLPRQFPSRANPDNMVTKRGPLDLASFARASGGLRDQGGELAASGITNAARKGDDFAGGENRLGPLVNNQSGADLETMAQRAWDEGYFPELDSPPTIQEFVAALDDTYRGVGRRFRPQDEGEIQAFEGARDQRFAVERAKQEGAPLVTDMGQPTSLDDMIANTPPASAYDDWNNAVVSKVGNIRVDKLDTPQDIGQALKIADNVAGGFDAAKRGKISFAETQALAQDLGMTADDLLARRKGQAFSAEEAYAARAILGKSTNELVNMAKRLHAMGDDPGSEAMATFRKAMVRHAAIQEHVSGMTAEAGRALSAFRMVADSRDIPGRVLESLVNAGGSSKRIKEAAEKIIDLERDPARLNRFVEKVNKPRFADKAQEIWYNWLLSGPQTHAANVLSNTLTSIAQIPEHAVAAGVSATRRAINREAGERVMMSEVGARIAGLMQGTKEGMREFAAGFRPIPTPGAAGPLSRANAVRKGVWKGLTDRQPADFTTRIEHQGQKAIGGRTGEAIRIPTAMLTAEDEIFKAMAQRMELSGLAVRQAAKEGLKGQQAKERAAELLNDPSDEMLARSLDYGRYLTFQTPLGDGLAGGLSRVTQNNPYLKAVLPFVRTPTNLIKFAAERSPLAPMVKGWRQDFEAGGARRDLAIARVLVGSGIGAVIAELAEKGVITGSVPSDRNRKGLKYADGWQPYSVKIGDTYYSYKRLDPFAITFGTAADIATLGEGMSEEQREKGAGLYVASIMSNLVSKTWLTGISDALETLQDPERSAGRFVERLVGSATVPTGVAQLARTIDPTARESDGVLEYLQSRIPGLSNNLLPKRDVWGQPIVNEGGVGPDIVSPIWTRTDRNDPITNEVLRVDGIISKPQSKGLTPEQYDRLQAAVGPVARAWLGELFASPEYKAMNQEDQADEIRKVMTAARKAGKANVLSGEPLPTQPPVGRRSAAPPGLPAGFQLDELPPGFTLDQ